MPRTTCLWYGPQPIGRQLYPPVFVNSLLTGDVSRLRAKSRSKRTMLNRRSFRPKACMHWHIECASALRKYADIVFRASKISPFSCGIQKASDMALHPEIEISFHSIPNIWDILPGSRELCPGSGRRSRLGSRALLGCHRGCHRTLVPQTPDTHHIVIYSFQENQIAMVPSSTDIAGNAQHASGKHCWYLLWQIDVRRDKAWDGVEGASGGRLLKQLMCWCLHTVLLLCFHLIEAVGGTILGILRLKKGALLRCGGRGVALPADLGASFCLCGPLLISACPVGTSQSLNLYYQ